LTSGQRVPVTLRLLIGAFKIPPHHVIYPAQMVIFTILEPGSEWTKTTFFYNQLYNVFIFICWSQRVAPYCNKWCNLCQLMMHSLLMHLRSNQDIPWCTWAYRTYGDSL